MTKNKILARNGVVVVVAIHLIGCVTNISHRAPFSAYLGTTLATKRPTFMYRSEGSPPEYRKTLNLEDNALARSRKDYRRINQVAFIPAGQSIRVDRVLQLVGDGSTSYDAMGEVFVPSLGRFVEFRYHLGAYDQIRRGIWVHRAPWEGLDVPAKRLIP